MSFPRTLSWMGVVALALVPAFGCSSSPAKSSGPPAPTGTQNPGTPPPNQLQGHDTNPYGVAYPTANLGTSARKGTVAGNVIANYKFLGYPNADPSQTTNVGQGLQTVALADYFDPQVKTYKLLHLGVAAVWCVPCNDETNALAGALTQQLAQSGVVFVQALDDGPTLGIGATPTNLNAWISGVGRAVKPAPPINFTDVLDPGNANLGAFFPAAAIPWNAYIDPRTMEILYADVGYSGDPQGDAQTWLDWISKNPPSY
jgi:hypothetical protein